MRTYDIIYLYREFERYDREHRDYKDTTPKLQRFIDYINKLIRVCSIMQAMIRGKDTTVIDRDYEYYDLSDFEVSNIEKAADYLVRVEKRNAADNAKRKEIENARN